jgi:hypothetical protein
MRGEREQRGIWTALEVDKERKHTLYARKLTGIKLHLPPILKHQLSVNLHVFRFLS